jgi:beta-lactamase regulating signal transducer with metallopeptidase domain
VDVLANWMWQGCAVTLAATIMMRLLTRLSATTRYRVWWITLAIVLALPWIPVLAPHRDTIAASAPAGTITTPTAIVLPNLPVWLEAMLIGAWMTWVARSLWLVGVALNALTRAKRSARPFPQAREARLRLWTGVKSTGRAATLVVSDEVRSAAVLGLGRPTIAVAPAILQDLDDGELDQVLVHEWAHVQRHDDIGRLSQVLVTAIVGAHPAIWWIDRQIDLERESACDDWSVNVVGSAKGYAACLIRLATLQNGHTDSLLMPAAWSPSTLTTRIVRVLDSRRSRSTTRRLPSLACMSSLLAATALVAAGFELVVKQQNVASPQRSSLFTNPSREPAPEPQAPTAVTASAPENVTARRSVTSRNRAHVTPIAPPITRSSAAMAQPIETTTSSDTPEHPPETTRSSSVAPAELTALPGVHAPVTGLTPEAVSATGQPPSNVTPWGVAADAGVSVGRGSQKAAVATAGFFSRLGKSIAGAF